MFRRALALVLVPTALLVAGCSGARSDDTTRTPTTPTTAGATSTVAAALAAVEGVEQAYTAVSADVSVRDGSTKLTDARTGVTTSLVAVRGSLQEMIAQNRASKTDCGALYTRRQAVANNLAAVNQAIEQSRLAQGELGTVIDQYAGKVAAVQAQSTTASSAVTGLSANEPAVVRLQTVNTSLNALNGVITAARQSVTAAGAADTDATNGANQQYDSARMIYQQCLDRAARIQDLKEQQKRNS